MTLRTRLVAILAILIAVGLILSGIATYGALRNFLYERIDDQLRQTQPIAVRILISAGEGPGFPPNDPEGGPPGLPISAYAEARDAAGEVIASESFGFSEEDATYVPDLPDNLDATDVDEPFTVAAIEDSSYRFRILAAQTVGGGILIVAIPLADAQETLQRLLWIEVVVAVLLMALIAFVALIVIRKELRALDQMADTATDIAAGNLSQRVEEGDPRTEVGRLGLALNRMLEHIEQAFDARRASEEKMRRFLGDASHELRTPLTSIRGYAELFRHGAADRPEDLRLSMRRIEEEAARMGILVEELLLLAHTDQNREMNITEVDLTELIRDAGEDARVQDPQRAIDVEAPDAVIVHGDADRLRQAVSNLVTNALVHTPSETPVELRLSTEGQMAIVEVEDSGPGLDDETLEHAFERFWRRDNSRSRGTGGAGLGLAIVDAIARSHGGEITVENRAQGGARFTLRLPIDPQASISANQRASQDEGSE